MSFVDHYLTYFRLITSLLLVLLPFQPLFTEISHGDQLFAPSLFSSVLSASPPLLCANFQFIVNCSDFLFFCRGGSLSRRLCWFIPGVAGGIPRDTWCSPVWSAEYLPSRFGDSIWQQWQHSCFLSVTWHGEAFYGLGVPGVEVLLLLDALFLPSMAPVSHQGF
jgi:hypothetical protein